MKYNLKDWVVIKKYAPSFKDIESLLPDDRRIQIQYLSNDEQPFYQWIAETGKLIWFSDDDIEALSSDQGAVENLDGTPVDVEPDQVEVEPEDPTIYPVRLHNDLPGFVAIYEGKMRFIEYKLDFEINIGNIPDIKFGKKIKFPNADG